MPQSTNTEFPVRDTAVRMELTEDATASDTSLSVNRIVGFDDSDTPFLARLWAKQVDGFREDYSEYIRVDGVDEQNNNLTVTRDYEGIGAVDPSEGDPIQPMVVKADVFDSNVAGGASETIVDRTLGNLVRSERNRIEFLIKNTQTDQLAAVGGDKSIFDIHDDKENLFELTNLTVKDITNNNTIEGFAVLSSDVEVYDFEDGNVDGWTGNTYSGNLEADSGTNISGNFSGRISSNDNDVEVGTPVDSLYRLDLNNAASVNDSLKIDPNIKIRIGSDTGDSNDDVTINLNQNAFFESSSSRLGALIFEDGSNDLIWNTIFNNNPVLASNFWSPNTNYNIEFKIDYEKDEVEIFVNGTKQGSTQSIQQKTGGFQSFEISNYTAASNSSRNVWIDDVTTTSGFQSSGTLKSKVKDLYQGAPGSGFLYPPEEAYLSLNADIPSGTDIGVDLKDGYGNSVSLTNGEMVDVSSLKSGILRVEETFTSSNKEKTPFQRSYAVHLAEGTGNWDDVISDSLFDQSKIANKSNVQIRTEKGGFDKEANLLPETNIDNFEDGNINGWTKQNSPTQFSADSSTVISGNFSGKLKADPDVSNGYVYATSPSAGKISENVWFTVRIGRDTGNTGDDVSFQIYDGNDTYIGSLIFEDSTNDLTWSTNSKTTLTSNFWSPNTNYQVELQIDYANSSVDVYINGTKQGTTQGFSNNSASHTDTIKVNNDASNASNPRSVWIDDLTVRDGGPGSGFETPGTFDRASTTNLDYVPSSVEIQAPKSVPSGENIEVDLTDENNNTDTISHTDFGSKQTLSNITGSDIDVTWRFTSNDGQDTPRINEYEIHFFE